MTEYHQTQERQQASLAPEPKQRKGHTISGSRRWGLSRRALAKLTFARAAATVAAGLTGDSVRAPASEPVADQANVEPKQHERLDSQQPVSFEGSSEVHSTEASVAINEILNNAPSIMIGEHGRRIDENVWTLAGKDHTWWDETYWYNPQNLGTFTLANFDTLRASYDARVKETPISASNRFPDGYPNKELVLTWIEDAKRELASVGLTEPTAEKIKEKAFVLNTIAIEPLKALWDATRLVRPGDQFKVPDVTNSQAIIDFYKQHP